MLDRDLVVEGQSLDQRPAVPSFASIHKLPA